jgi:hypothetical protein
MISALSTYPRRLAHRRLAGRRAQARYLELRGVWLRNRRRQFAILGLILAALAAAATVYDEMWFGRLGVVTGGAWGGVTAIWFALRNSPPGFVENWQQGSWGEQSTADELAQLPRAAWVPIHDLPDGHGNLDHVVLGPGGVFLLDSKRYAGSIRVDGDDLVVTNELDPRVSYRDTGRLSRARGQAAGLNARLRGRSGLSPWVEPVVVIWGTFPARVHKGNGVTVVHGRELVAWLKLRPARGANVLALAEHLQPGRHRRTGPGDTDGSVMATHR